MEAHPHPVLARAARDDGDPHLDLARLTWRPRGGRAALALALVCAGSAARAQVPPPGAPPPPGDDPDVQDISPDEPPPALPPPAPTTPPPAPTTPAPAPATTPAPGPPPDGAPATPERVHTMDEVTIPKSLLRFGINFFGDVSATLRYPERPRSVFSLGTLGMRLLGQLGPSLDALAELAFETTDEGSIADVEQLAMRWRRGPGELVVGRFHTDFGYWNTTYHHGLWLQIPIARPHAVQFEDSGGLIPAHWVGAQYRLKRRVSGGDGALVLAVGNGRGNIPDDIRVVDDTNEAKAGLVKVRWGRSGAEVGLGFYYDLIAPAPVAIRPALPEQRIHELAGSAYVAVRRAGLVAIAEGYAFHHRAAGRSWTTLAGYGLLGVELAPWIMPYAATDLVRGADEDPYFSPDPTTSPPLDVLELLGGLRFETSVWSAFKLELRLTHRPRDPDRDDDYAAIANWSFGL